MATRRAAVDAEAPVLDAEAPLLRIHSLLRNHIDPCFYLEQSK